MNLIKINEMKDHVGEEVTINGWLYNKRSSGKIKFLIIRDGSGFVQGIVVKNEVDENVFELCDKLTQESSISVSGIVRKDERSPFGFELTIKNVDLVQMAFNDYPISLKEHGIDFLLDNRHLWIRTPRQQAILSVRHEVIRAIQEFLNNNDFVRIDSPIITPSTCEGTSDLFQIDYFGENAYLSQTGQLYQEAAAMAFGKVYSFGPTFRAEKSKTRRHLNEFWMVEPEMAFVDHYGNMEVQEKLVEYIVQSVLENCSRELKELGRDLSKLEKIKTPFPRLTYDEAIELLNKNGYEIQWGNDLGSPDETFLSNQFDKPVFITEYPAECKAFYMQPKEDRPEVVLCADLLAPEGYGEIIGGSQRIHDYDLLLKRLKEENLPIDMYNWYLDLRKYGTVPHSGFGLGIERTVAWITNTEHVRECIPFPRTLSRIRP
ncbi:MULTISPECIES: asparagine--tRNA ligase [Thermoanaerobacterium]|uniref:Asparagine--tRNA ligase n=2 Tax=Thermoanaerobacterium TaxID=28895 RepID=W9EB42_9THEO|nr:MULTISPECIES: asparagine--tRNA ligase [Thermoanaerobacterium]AFK86863.1 Asparaginyl-tRNA synthetase [Thermoanaerobacterium saccharolyticum JW/SL-YS485]ETO39328.1 Asparaginyl-tRNA synthetase [Thermoanaerobacterium aotearoense SCUT27]